jgi:hypothetical protein
MATRTDKVGDLWSTMHDEPQSLRAAIKELQKR